MKAHKKRKREMTMAGVGVGVKGMWWGAGEAHKKNEKGREMTITGHVLSAR